MRQIPAEELRLSVGKWLGAVLAFFASRPSVLARLFRQSTCLWNSDAKNQEFRANPAFDHPADETPHSEGLDRFDIAILTALQAEARLTNTELASRIGLSPAPTWRRVKWLEEQGYITGYRAEIDRRKIGLGVLAFVRVDAERNNADATRTLEAAIRALPEVVACYYISGTGTFELHVMVTEVRHFARGFRSVGQW